MEHDDSRDVELSEFSTSEIAVPAPAGGDVEHEAPESGWVDLDESESGWVDLGDVEPASGGQLGAESIDNAADFRLRYPKLAKVRPWESIVGRVFTLVHEETIDMRSAAFAATGMSSGYFIDLLNIYDICPSLSLDRRKTIKFVVDEGGRPLIFSISWDLASDRYAHWVPRVAVWFDFSSSNQGVRHVKVNLEGRLEFSGTGKPVAAAHVTGTVEATIDVPHLGSQHFSRNIGAVLRGNGTWIAPGADEY